MKNCSQPSGKYWNSCRETNMKQKTKKITVLVQFLISVALLTGLDQWTKYLAVRHLKDQPDIPLIDNVLYLHYLENRGAAFGLFQNQFLFFGIMTVIILCAVIYVLWHMPSDKKYLFLRIICFVICAGAIGNFIDRVRLNYVVDFIYFSPINFPVFNVADIYVVVSMALFLISFLFIYKEEDFAFLSGKGKKK